eukprot:Gb_39297 [translate_table: standard]
MRALITTAMLLLLGTSSMLLVFHNRLQGLVWPGHATISTTRSHRKLQEGSYDPSSINFRRDLSELNLKDYRLVDPAPSSRTSIKSGPIEHNAPLIPWIITQPPPPSPPQHFHAP